MGVVPADDPNRMTEAEYLTFEDESEFKHEYSQGIIYAMTVGSVRHGVITANIIVEFGNKLADRDCTVTSSDVRVHIASRSVYRYPDGDGILRRAGVPAGVQRHDHEPGGAGGGVVARHHPSRPRRKAA